MRYRRLRDLREDHDLKQINVASMLNMSQTGYSKYETGENDIPTHILIQLADFYPWQTTTTSASTICSIKPIIRNETNDGSLPSTE